MSQSKQSIQQLWSCIKDFQDFNCNIKRALYELRYVCKLQTDGQEYDTLYAEIQQNIKDKINKLSYSMAQVLRIQEYKIVTIIKHAQLAQVQINTLKNIQQEYQSNIQQLQNQIGNLAGKCTDQQIQLNQLKTKNKSLLQQFSTLSQFSNKKVLQLQNQKRIHKKLSSASLKLPAQFNLQMFNKKTNKQAQLFRKPSDHQNRSNNPESRQHFIYKSPKKYNEIQIQNDAISTLQMTYSQKKFKNELSFGCVPMKKVIHQSDKKQKNDYQNYKKSTTDMNRRFQYLLTTLSNTKQPILNNINKQIGKEHQKTVIPASIKVCQI